MSSLSIELENHPVVNHLKGYLLLQNDSLLPDSICHLQLVGTQSEPILLEPPYLRFDIPLPLLSEDMEYSLRASVRGSKNGKTLYAARPLNLIQTPPPSYPSSLCSTLSSSSSLSTIIQPRVCWGISALSQWKYELELPQQINGFDPFLIGLRTFSRMKHQSRETCLIGIQIYESSRSVTYSRDYLSSSDHPELPHRAKSD
ncbi:hypothetical protein BC941DRAFT_448853 [Chlamydoabsidia padenii]|nr:hypothetical protein BC941DRAFT_448853 [Chlamydoabsidia padenii]